MSVLTGMADSLFTIAIRQQQLGALKADWIQRWQLAAKQRQVHGPQANVGEQETYQ